MQHQSNCHRFANFSALMLAAPGVLLVFIACALPLLWLLGCLFNHGVLSSIFSFCGYRFELLLRTLGYNAAAAVLATLMGLPAALVLGRGRGIFARLLWLVLPAMLLMPSLSYTYGWSQFLRLARPLLEPLGITFSPAGLADVLRCIWTLAAWLWPIPAGIIALALRRMDHSLAQHAVLDGVLWRITLRQLFGPILASLAIVLMLATQEFSVYEPTGISVVATEVRLVFESAAFSNLSSAADLPPDQAARAAAAVATALPLLLVTFLLAILVIWGAKRQSHGDNIATGPIPRILAAPWWSILLTCLLVLLTFGVPVASLVHSLSIPISPIHMWQQFGTPAMGAISIALLAILLTLLLSFSASGHWPRGLLLLAGFCFLLGGQLLAISLIRIYNRFGLDWAYDSWPVPVLAYVGRFGWLALAAAHGTWSTSWRELRDMAAADGAGPFRTALHIIWPLAWPSLLGGALLVGALSLTEVPLTVLLQPQRPQVLTPMLMTWVHMVRYDPMIEAALFMMALVLIPGIAAIGLALLGSRAGRLALRNGNSPASR